MMTESVEDRPSSVKEKIARMKIRRQQRRAFEARMRAEGRLPPGQRITQKFPVLHLGSVPAFDPENWSFKIFGAVKNPVALTWTQFQQLPRTTVTLDLHCVTQWSKFDTVWEGVSLRTLIEVGLVEPNEGATHLIQVAEAGYRTNLPLSIALQDNFLLATHVNGEVIEPKHGYPVRGVTGHIVGRHDIEDVYLWKGAKWLRGLKFATDDEPGTWERTGYHNEGDVWREERWGFRVGG